MRYYANIPFANKNQAKKEFGAKWDKENECWYVDSKEKKEAIKHLEELPTKKAKKCDSAEEEFIEFLRLNGMDEPNPVLDGNMHSCMLFESRSRTKKGSYAYYTDGIVPAGWCFNNKSRIKTTWVANGKGAIESIAYDQANRAQRNYDRFVGDRQKWLKASKDCYSYYNSALPAPESHPYLISKGIKADSEVRYLDSHSFKYIDKNGNEKEMSFKKVLLIPSKATDGYIKSLQYIEENGSKKHHPGGQKSGCFKIIGNPESAKNLIVCEGYATGKTIFDNYPNSAVYCAYDCGNMYTVSEIIHNQFSESDKTLIVAADNDWGADRDKNDGLIKAQKIKDIFKEFELAVPYFSKDSTGSDWNDLWLEEGSKAFDKFLPKEDPHVDVGATEAINESDIETIDLIVDKYSEYVKLNNIPHEKRIEEDSFNLWFDENANEYPQFKESVHYYYNVEWLDEDSKIQNEQSTAKHIAETIKDITEDRLDVNHTSLEEVCNQDQELLIDSAVEQYQDEVQRLGLVGSQKINRDFFRNWFDDSGYRQILADKVYIKATEKWLESQDIKDSEVKLTSSEIHNTELSEKVFYLTEHITKSDMQRQYSLSKTDLMKSIFKSAENMIELKDTDLNIALHREYFNICEDLKIFSKSQYRIGTLKSQDLCMPSNNRGLSLSNVFGSYDTLEEAMENSSKFPVANVIERVVENNSETNQFISVHDHDLKGNVLDYEGYSKIWNSGQNEYFDIIFSRPGKGGNAQVISQHDTLEAAVEASNLTPKATSIQHSIYKDCEPVCKMDDYLLNGEKLSDDLRAEKNEFLMQAYSEKSSIANPADDEDYFYVMKEREFVQERESKNKGISF